MDKESQNTSQRHQQGKFLYFLLAGVFIAAALLTWPETALTVLFGVMAIVFVGLAMKNLVAKKASETGNLDKEKKELNTRLQKIDKELEDYQNVDENKLRYVVDKEKEKKHFVKDLIRQVHSLQERIGHLQEEMEKVASLIDKVLQDLRKWCVDYHLPYKEDFLFYEEVLVAYDRWKTLFEQLQQLEEKQSEIRNFQEPFEKTVYQLSKEIDESVHQEKTISQQIDCLKVFVNEGQSLVKKQESLQAKQSMKKEGIATIEQELNQIASELSNLLHLGEVASEEEFRRKGRLFERQEKLRGERLQTWTQMKLIMKDEEELKLVIHQLLNDEYNPVEQLAEWNEQCKQLEVLAEECRTELAACRQELTFLMEDGSYEELLQELTQMKEELNTLAKRWAVLAVSKHIIQEIKRVYEQEKQPAVIQEGEKLFRLMTNGEYTRLFAPLGEERFVLERKDGLRFDPGEVSRGTCELLYLAIRFALAGKFSKEENFPLIMDETFVNIDRKRRQRIVEMLHTIAKDRQILIFSCHHHICEEVKGTIIRLSPETTPFSL